MDGQKIVNAICKCLQVLANFKPAIVDNDGNAVGDVSGRQPPLHKQDGTPAKDIKDVYLCDIFKKIDAEDKAAKPPPPMPRLKVFVACLKAATCDFPLESQQLANCEYPTIESLVFLIQQNCP